MSSKIISLFDRAAMLSAARSFFQERSILEIDSPILTTYASIDEHIDLIQTTCGRYLHTSPEYAMKRLLVHGLGDIYYLGHVFRKEEIGQKHNPEFMMAEWYRLNFSFEEMIEETIAFISIFIGKISIKQATYRDTFLSFTQLDIAHTTHEQLIEFCRENHISLYSGIENEGKDALLNLILANYIEPHLGKDELFVLTHYPATQCALAQKTVIYDFEVAERFEIYYKGIELANGYHELANADEQKERFIEANRQRKLNNKDELPLDQYFLSTLEKGLPDCCGVAVGFDRLMMLRHKTFNIKDIIAFDWNQI